MSPFYSDRQRRFFFAVIAPMRSWGGEVVASYVLDPIAKALGWKKVEQKEAIKSIEKALKDSDHIAVLTESEVEKIHQVSPETLIRDKMADIVAENLKNVPVLGDAILKLPKLFLNKSDLAVLKNVAISSGYGSRTHPVTGEKEKFHKGIDIKVGKERGIPAPCPKEGIVIYIGEGYTHAGKVVDVLIKPSKPGEEARIRRFEHLDDWNVQVGDKVNPGEAVGLIGKTGRCTGIHLHYQDGPNYLMFRNKKGKDEPIGYEQVDMMGKKMLDKFTYRKKNKAGKFESMAPTKTLKIDDNRRFNLSQKPDKAEVNSIIRSAYRDIALKKAAQRVIEKFCAENKPTPVPKPQPKPKTSAKNSQKKTGRK